MTSQEIQEWCHRVSAAFNHPVPVCISFFAGEEHGARRSGWWVRIARDEAIADTLEEACREAVKAAKHKATETLEQLESSATHARAVVARLSDAAKV